MRTSVKFINQINYIQYPQGQYMPFMSERGTVFELSKVWEGKSG